MCKRRATLRLWNQHSTVIISTSVNSANFGITRFKSNCRNSTECRFSASATDNAHRSSANQRKTATSRQEASSQLPDLLTVFHRILSSRDTLSLLCCWHRAPRSRVSLSSIWFRNLRQVAGDNRGTKYREPVQSKTRRNVRMPIANSRFFLRIYEIYRATAVLVYERTVKRRAKAFASEQGVKLIREVEE